MTGAALGGVALAAHVIWFVLARRLARRTGLTRMESLVAAYATTLTIPTLLAIWLFWLPVGIEGAVALSSSIIIAIGAFVLVSGRLPDEGPRWRPQRGNWPAVAPALVITGLVVLTMVATLSKPVEEIDGLLYHGPAAGNAIQHSSLFGWDAPAPYVFYPAFIAIQGAMVVLAIGSTDLLDAVQVPYMLLLAGVVWAWAGRGRPRPIPGLLAAAVISTPAVYANARALYVDVAYAGILLSGLWMLWLWLRSRSLLLLLAGTLLIGAGAATKPAGLTICVAAGAVIVLLALVRRRREDMIAVAVAAAGVIAGGAAFYLRNLVEFGNPLYPVSTTVAGVKLDGLIDLSVFDAPPPPPLPEIPAPLALLQNIWLGATNWYAPIYYDARIGAFGPVMVVIGGLALLAVALVIVRRGWRDRIALWSVLCPLLAAAAVTVLQPQAWYPRYVIVVVALVAVAVGVAIEGARLPERLVLGISLAGLILVVSFTWLTEQRMVQGLPMLRDNGANPNYNAGISGDTTAYQSEYRWVRGAPCGTRVVVAATTFQMGLLNSYGIGLWGDRLCNDVRLVRDVRGAGDAGLEGDRSVLESAIPEADYVVAFEQDRALVAEIAAGKGLRAIVVSDTFEFYGADQVVMAIIRPG